MPSLFCLSDSPTKFHPERPSVSPMRRVAAFSCILATFCGLSADAQDLQKSAAVDQPNVVIIVADDLGFQLGCYGDPIAKTPGVDRLAAHGTRFLRAYCTTASCSASRSVLMTGQFNHSTGHFGHSHGYSHFSTYESVPTLPVLLSEAGYRTCSIGKYHLAPDYIYHFQDYRNDGSAGGRSSVVMAKNAKEWIEEDQTRPFFLYWCSTDPHRGGGPGGFANFNDDPDRYPGVTPVRYSPDEIPMPRWLPDNAEARNEMAEYYQAVSRFDQGVSHLLDALVETGHWDDTLILLLSDNGPPFPAAKTTLYQAGMNLPLIVRDPRQKTTGITSDAMVSWADVTPTVLDYCSVKPEPRQPIQPRENRGPAAEDAATNGRNARNAVRPVQFAGQSFVSALDGQHDSDYQQVFASHTFHEITNYYPMRVLIQNEYKYIFNIAHQLPYPFASDLYASPTWQGVLKRGEEMYGVRPVYQYLYRPRHELYNLADDPDELVNLATQPEHQQRLQSMQQAVQAWQKQTQDPWASKWVYE